MDVNQVLTAVAAVVGAVAAGGFGAWVLKFFQLRHEQARQARREDHDLERLEKQDVWDKQQDIIARLGNQLVEVQRAQQRSAAAELACREEVARLRALGQWLLDLCKSMHRTMEKKGLDPDPIPDIPDFGRLSTTTRAKEEFSQRSLEQATRLLSEEAEQHRNEPRP